MDDFLTSMVYVKHCNNNHTATAARSVESTKEAATWAELLKACLANPGLAKILLSVL